MNEKRQEIVDSLNEALAKEPLALSYSSPKLKGIKCFYITKPEPREKAKFVQPEKKMAEDDIETKAPATDAPSPPPVAPQPKKEEKEEKKVEDLTYKELKQKQKQERKQEKIINKTRKDLRKRGFDTGVLKRFDDPEDVYSLSDDEITQIEIAGYINEDGYYTFVYPPDINSAKEEPFSTKRILLILLCVTAGMFLIWRVVSNFIDIF